MTNRNNGIARGDENASVTKAMHRLLELLATSVADRLHAGDGDGLSGDGGHHRDPENSVDSSSLVSGGFLFGGRR
jgi:hypothetical protein